MSAQVDITGQRFGHLLALSYSGKHGRKLYWLCRCDCGTERAVQKGLLTAGLSNSCGCANKRPPGHASRHHRYLTYRGEASRRGLSFTLTEDEFSRLTQEDCHYCGLAPSTLHHARGNGYNGDFRYNGLDRQDNARGYDADNLVACCPECNQAKRTQSYATFTAWLDRVTVFRTNRIGA